MVDSRQTTNLQYGDFSFETISSAGAAPGGVRLFFTCPSCGERAYRLYQPTPEDDFACKSCHQLTNRSTQAQRKKPRHEQLQDDFTRKLKRVDFLLDRLNNRKRHTWKSAAELAEVQQLLAECSAIEAERKREFAAYYGIEEGAPDAGSNHRYPSQQSKS